MVGTSALLVDFSCVPLYHRGTIGRHMRHICCVDVLHTPCDLGSASGDTAAIVP